MKRLFTIFTALALCAGLCACVAPRQDCQLVATTAPVYQFTAALCDGTGLQVTQLITENVSCLHDYTLQVSQMRDIEGAEAVVISGAGLEGFLSDAIPQGKTVIDASGITLQEQDHHDHGHDHHHQVDPHLWLSVTHAKVMAENIYQGLCKLYPDWEAVFSANLATLMDEFDKLESYADQQLSGISHYEIITFHDGFGYLAKDYGITILRAIEEESGSEASARELIELAQLIEDKQVAAIFTEKNGSTSAARILSDETGVPVYTLDMAMATDDYFEAMYHNINTLKEALE